MTRRADQLAVVDAGALVTLAGAELYVVDGGVFRVVNELYVVDGNEFVQLWPLVGATTEGAAADVIRAVMGAMRVDPPAVVTADVIRATMGPMQIGVPSQVADVIRATMGPMQVFPPSYDAADVIRATMGPMEVDPPARYAADVIRATMGPMMVDGLMYETGDVIRATMGPMQIGVPPAPKRGSATPIALSLSLSQPTGFATEALVCSVPTLSMVPGQSASVSPEVSGGTAPYSYEHFGTPSTGLTVQVDSATGEITVASLSTLDEGIYSGGFLNVTDANGVTRGCQIVVALRNLTCTTVVLNVLRGGSAVGATTAGGGTAPYTFSLSPNVPAPAGITVEVSASGGITVTAASTATPGVNLAGAVRITDANGVFVDCSIIANVTAPLTTAPAGTSERWDGATSEMVFEWDALAGADSYVLRLQRQDGTQIVQPVSVDGTSYRHAFTEADRTQVFRWSVAGFNPAGTGPYSAWIQFSPFRPSVAYNPPNPTSADTVTAAFSDTTGITAYQWQVRRGTSLNPFLPEGWGFIEGQTTTTLDSGVSQGAQVRITWTRNLILEVGPAITIG